MPLVYVTRRTHFNAAHRLHNPQKSDEWNRETFGKCNNPNWHGHNYILEVTVKGTPDPDTGYVIDLSDLKRIIEERIIDRCDHRNLNEDVDFLRGILPSTENFVVAIWKQLEAALPAGHLHRVRLYETERNMAEYYGEVSQTTNAE
jgi:6-pyruvoyltetrahydropterin/6-carboxytetrahydropterin synthase